MKKLRIAIASSGRFHVCDLARELKQFGNKVAFYSLVPPKRTGQFGLPRECNRWMLPRVLPWALWTRVVRGPQAKENANSRLGERLDKAIARSLEPCDAFIGMSGLSNRSAVVAKKKHGAKVWIERGSTHILCQKRILDMLPVAAKVTEETVRREMIDYGNADFISVLSQHCLESFLEQGIERERLFLNPVGVDLSMFHATESPTADRPTIIMVGTWSYRKGCHWLTEAWRQLKGVRLLHVGSVGDCPLPEGEGFEHVDPVDQSKLLSFYRDAHVLVMASAEEGLAVVQPQALACGLRLVCTTRTGGADLQRFVADPETISVVEPGDIDAMVTAIRYQMKIALLESGMRSRLTPPAFNDLAWTGYAKRYERELCEKVVD